LPATQQARKVFFGNILVESAVPRIGALERLRVRRCSRVGCTCADIEWRDMPHTPTKQVGEVFNAFLKPLNGTNEGKLVSNYIASVFEMCFTDIGVTDTCDHSDLVVAELKGPTAVDRAWEVKAAVRKRMPHIGILTLDVKPE
jgi:hypothetical protein